MDIQFERPFGFRLEVIETDDNVPSLRVSVQVTVEQFQHLCRYEGKFWVECAVWDSFVKTLHTHSDEVASFHDMSDFFMLSVQRVNDGLTLTWKFAKADVGEGRHMAITFTSPIDEDVLAIIRRQFEEFPAWWVLSN